MALAWFDADVVRSAPRLDKGDDSAFTIAKATVVFKNGEATTGACRADHLVKLMERRRKRK